MNDDNLRSIWQGMAEDFTPMTIDQLHQNAAQFSRTIEWRNRREYFAGIVVAVVFALYAWIFPSMLMKIGSLLTVGAAIFVSWQLHLRTSRPDSTDDTSNIVAHYRMRLVIERDALSSVGKWYLAPFAPGFLLFSAGKMEALTKIQAGWIALHLGVPVAVFVAIWLLNKSGARALSRKIEALDVSQSGST
jgi:hypothetical protein